jgi:hypothetical protein
MAKEAVNGEGITARTVPGKETTVNEACKVS